MLDIKWQPFGTQMIVLQFEFRGFVVGGGDYQLGDALWSTLHRGLSPGLEEIRHAFFFFVEGVFDAVSVGYGVL